MTVPVQNFEPSNAQTVADKEAGNPGLKRYLLPNLKSGGIDVHKYNSTPDLSPSSILVLRRGEDELHLKESSHKNLVSLMPCL